MLELKAQQSAVDQRERDSREGEILDAVKVRESLRRRKEVHFQPRGWVWAQGHGGRV